MKTKEDKDWLTYVEAMLKEHDAVPLLGNIAPFGWDEFTLAFQKIFALNDITFSISEFKWRMEQDIWEGMGDHIYHLNACILPLEGLVSLGITDIDLSLLSKWILNTQDIENSETQSLFDKPLKEGMLYFLGMEVLHIIDNMHYLPKVSFRIAGHKNELSQPGLTADICLKHGKEKAWVRLVISSSLRKSFSQYILKTNPSFDLTSAHHIDITTHLELGRVCLDMASWQKLQIGDFILLDQCHYNPFEKKGRLIMTIGDKPIFRVMVKEENIKLLEYSFVREGGMDEEFDTDDDIELDEELKTSMEEELQEEIAEEEDVQSADEKTSIALEDIPMTVVVEIKRMKMTAKKLLELRPGNLLELDIDPEAPVNLVSGGRRVGRGELIRIGDVLGIRVLEVG